MTSNADALRNLLFGDQEKALVNLKLMRGDSHDFSKEESCGEIRSALSQVQSGQSVSSSRFSELVDDSSKIGPATSVKE